MNRIYQCFVDLQKCIDSYSFSNLGKMLKLNIINKCSINCNISINASIHMDLFERLKQMHEIVELPDENLKVVNCNPINSN